MRHSTAATITALFLAETTVTFEGAMIYAALPKLIREFGDPVMAGWLLTAHLLIAAATAPVFGRLGDMRGRKRLIQLLMAAALIGSVLSAMTSVFALILVGRAMQGMSSAVIPLSVGVVREALPPEKVPLGIGLLTTAQGVGATLGLLLGGWLVDNFPWQSLFTASAILLALSLAAVAWCVPDRPGAAPEKKIDWSEGLLPVPAIGALLFAISHAKSVGWLSPQVLLLIAFGVGLLLWWGRKSLAAAEPFIDLKLFLIRNFLFANIAAMLLGMGTMQVLYVFSAYAQSPGWTMVGLGLTATVAGLTKLPSNVLSFFAGPLSGWMTLHWGDRITVVCGAILAASGWLLAISLPTSVFAVVGILCVISFGTTILQAAIPNVVVGAVPEGRTSEAIGSMQVMRGLAAAIGAQLIALLLASNTILAPDGAGQFPVAESYQLTMGVIVLLTLGGAICGFFMRSKPVR